jgi:hypothetical protein
MLFINSIALYTESMKFHPSILIFLISLLQLISSCSHPQAINPLPQLWADDQKQHDTLIIFLPGVRDDKQDFLNKGLFARLQQSGIKADMVATGLNLAYLKESTGMTRLHEDIITPAQTNGYKNIWLVGISLGGLNALLYLKNRPEDICGLILLSPYLGEKKISNEIIQAGGIGKWHPVKINDWNDEETLWSWLKKADLNNVYLGTGSEDRFFSLQQQLAQLLPTKNTHVIKGGHRWPVWQELWKYFVILMKIEKGFEQCIDVSHPL